MFFLIFYDLFWFFDKFCMFWESELFIFIGLFIKSLKLYNGSDKLFEFLILFSLSITDLSYKYGLNYFNSETSPKFSLLFYYLSLLC
jgi:hypothetical protein